MSSGLASSGNARALRKEPRRFSLFRLIFFDTVERLLIVCGGRRFYRRFFLARGRFLEREEIVRVPGLPRELDGFTIAQLSDLHAGPFLRPGHLRDVVDAVNARSVDVCVITGDFVAHRAEEARLVVDDLARLQSRRGTFAVFGNHDYKGREEDSIAEACGAAGVRFLRNECVRFEEGDAVLALTGVEDLEEGRIVDIDLAREGLAEGDFEVALCHNPGGAPAIARERCCAILSGHTHGLQMDLPFLRTLGPKHPGLRVECGPTVLIVSRGLGVVGAPFRWGAPTEIVFCRLEREACKAASV